MEDVNRMTGRRRTFQDAFGHLNQRVVPLIEEGPEGPSLLELNGGDPEMIDL